MSAPPTAAPVKDVVNTTETANNRSSKKRKQPIPATEGAAATSDTTAAQPGRVVIPLRSKRLRKHAALIQTATSGFLLCCTRKRETECMQSLLPILQLYADQLYGVWVKGKEEEELEDGGGEEGAATEQPTADGEQESHTAHIKHRGRFSLVSAGGVEGLAFIGCNDQLVSTTQLTLRLFSDLQSRSLPLPLSSHLSRLLPVHTTSSATSIDHILGRFHHLTTELLPPSQSPDSSSASPLTFAVVFRASNCRAVERNVAITALAARVEEEARKASVTVAVRLVGAERTVLCWLVKSVAMLAVLPDYHKHLDYSIDKLNKVANAGNDHANSSNVDRLKNERSAGNGVH